MIQNSLTWQAKLAARIHDPAEKALVLLRDPAGHENGTSLALKRLLNLGVLDTQASDLDDSALSSMVFKSGLPALVYQHVQRADWWAAGADRPQWPMEKVTVSNKAGQLQTLAVAKWAQVRWANDPVLIHPLTGKQFRLPGGLTDTSIDTVKSKSFLHHANLLKALGAQKSGEQLDLRKIAMTFWRFGPELKDEESDNDRLGALWGVLPADTRIPDHSIWDHLDLTSAFAGAFASDPEGDAALLTVALGPVQSFIAASRTTSDLWAGSHLLSRLAWEAMKPVCEMYGPDAILFPRLRGVPQVDLWLRDEVGLPASMFADCEWNHGTTDANPLFSAALPNRFVAVVPAAEAKKIALELTQRVQDWIQQLGQDSVDRLLEVAGLAKGEAQYCHSQMREQLAGFPEVHWASVPFSMIKAADKQRQTNLDVSALLQGMAPYFGASPNTPCGFLDTPAWKVLQNDILWGDGTTFFAPNPGALYPAVFDLAERVLAATKASRTFVQREQVGWRCSLTGETEWLTTDPAQLLQPPRNQTDTLWAHVSRKKPAWARKGEHLGGLSAIKRLWPSVFAEEAGHAVGRSLNRFVVSTHTMALAGQIDAWLSRGGFTAPGFGELVENTDVGAVALPKRLITQHSTNPRGLEIAKILPGLIESAREKEDEVELTRARQLVQQTLALGGENPSVGIEGYYSLIMMDGDRMGAILSGDESNAISYRSSFHPKVQKGFDEAAMRQPAIAAYGAQKRSITPNRHLAISGALNDFSQTVVRHIVEDEHLGRVIYAGGDDVLAMLPVIDMLSAMKRLRIAYSGHDDSHTGGLDAHLTFKDGFAWMDRSSLGLRQAKLMRMMGQQATASCGAVVAHHQAPMNTVLQALRVAEKRAKTEGQRDAFSITIIKRSGGALYLTSKWGTTLDLLSQTILFLRSEGTSRRAVYNTLEWLKDIPDPNAGAEMLSALLALQLQRQSRGQDEFDTFLLAKSLAQLTAEHADGLRWLANFLSVAEFLARETRTGVSKK